MSETKPTRRVLKLIEAREEIVDSVWGEQRLYNHSFLCSVGFPHKVLPVETRTYQKQSGAITLQLTAGHLPSASGGFIPVGIPGGSRARLLMLHLQSQSVLTQSRQVEVADSFTAFARSLGMNTDGRSLSSLREQINRTSAVSMSLSNSATRETFQSFIFSRFQSELPDDPRQKTLFSSYVEFSKDFHESLMAHSVPLRLEAIQVLKHNSRALDLYCWASFRLRLLKRPTKVAWTSLRFQFGDRRQDMRGFKRRFLESLKQVLTVYPEARIEKVYGGLLIKPSPAPVPYYLGRNKKLLQ